MILVARYIRIGCLFNGVSEVENALRQRRLAKYVNLLQIHVILT